MAVAMPRRFWLHPNQKIGLAGGPRITWRQLWMIWSRTILHWLKQLMWLTVGCSGGCWLQVMICTPLSASQRWVCASQRRRCRTTTYNDDVVWRWRQRRDCSLVSMEDRLKFIMLKAPSRGSWVWTSCPRLLQSSITSLPGFELTTFRSQVQRPVVVNVLILLNSCCHIFSLSVLSAVTDSVDKARSKSSWSLHDWHSVFPWYIFGSRGGTPGQLPPKCEKLSMCKISDKSV